MMNLHGEGSVQPPLDPAMAPTANEVTKSVPWWRIQWFSAGVEHVAYFDHWAQVDDFHIWLGKKRVSSAVRPATSTDLVSAAVNILT
jgi:hypothetical protein